VSRFAFLANLSTSDRHLVQAASDASERAYAPYSKFAVGAAVRTKSGNVYTGANLENASYGVTICGEIGAITAANTAGDFEVEAIAVVGRKLSPPQDDTLVVTPCGRCRQIIFEAGQVAGTNVKVFSCNADLSNILESTIDELLPYGFGPANLGLHSERPNSPEAVKATSRIAETAKHR
jgi:cytidine deaminase